MIVQGPLEFPIIANFGPKLPIIGTTFRPKHMLHEHMDP